MTLSICTLNLGLGSSLRHLKQRCDRKRTIHSHPKCTVRNPQGDATSTAEPNECLKCRGLHRGRYDKTCMASIYSKNASLCSLILLLTCKVSTRLCKRHSSIALHGISFAFSTSDQIAYHWLGVHVVPFLSASPCKGRMPCGHTDGVSPGGTATGNHLPVLVTQILSYTQQKVMRKKIP